MNRRPSQRRVQSPSAAGAQRYRTTDPDRFLAETRRKKPLGRRILRAFFWFLALLFAANAFLSLYPRLSRISVPVTGLNPALEGYTLLHLSDLKGTSFGQHQGRLESLLRDERFDAVVLSGDMVSERGNAQPLYDLIEMLRRIRPAAPVYFIAGDSDPQAVSMDYASGGSPFAPWVLGCQQRGARWLTSPVLLSAGPQDVWLAPSSDLSLDTESQQARFEQLYLLAKESGDENEIELAEYQLRRLEGQRSARSAMKKDAVCIAVTHVPPEESFLSALRSPSGGSIALMLSGHWLGGLVRVPFAGPLFLPSSSLPRYGLFPRRDVSGISRVGATWLYQNPGLGAYDPLYPSFFRRFFNPPTAALLTLIPSSL
ncbi:MAG: metallophosphoesterase [Clostridia bacterium]|nr:metallophosphoesterase [Clostridia bacterium]